MSDDSLDTTVPIPLQPLPQRPDQESTTDLTQALISAENPEPVPELEPELQEHPAPDLTESAPPVSELPVTESPVVPDSDEPNLAQSSAAMAVGTIASRVTGMVRDIAIVAAIGFGVFGDTYSVANTVPNIIYILIAGGALNAIFIPQLVRHMGDDTDGGKIYADRLLTLVAVILLGVTVLVVALAPLIIGIYGPSAWSSDDVNTAVLFARFCLPQIIFYGLFAMFSQVLNARKQFTAPMYAPIVNNVVVIITALLFLGVVQSDSPTTASITSGQIALLGLGTTLGIAAQAGVLIPVMRRAGYRWSPRFDFAGAGLGKVRYLAGWTFLFVLTNQISYVVITRLASKANVLASADPALASAGFTSYSRAYLLFMLPHSIITVSIVTFLLPQMSRAVAAGRKSDVARDIGDGTLMAGAVIVPAAVALFLGGPYLAQVLFSFGAASADEARFVGVILQAFMLGLVPFTVFYVLLRGFYSFENTKTPALINIGMNLINIVAAVTLYSVVDVRWKVPALALGYSLSYLITVPITWRILSRTTGPLPTFGVIRGLVRMLIAAALAGIAIWAVLSLVTRGLGSSRIDLLLALLIAYAVGAGAYIVSARIMHIEQINDVTNVVRDRLPTLHIKK